MTNPVRHNWTHGPLGTDPLDVRPITAQVAYIIGNKIDPSTPVTFAGPQDGVTFDQWVCAYPTVFSNVSFSDPFDAGASSDFIYLKAVGLYAIFASAQYSYDGTNTGRGIVAVVGSGADTLSEDIRGFVYDDFGGSIANAHPTVPTNDFPVRDHRVIYQAAVNTFNAEAILYLDGGTGSTADYYGAQLAVAFFGLIPEA